MNIPKSLIIAGDAIGKHYPAAWTEFLKGLQEQLDKVANEFVNAPPDKILVHQGRVQAMSVLLDELKQVHTYAERLQKVSTKGN